ncbi:MAG: type II toxin-antitoxin system HicB family antitoxin [Dehalococcoidia bacterium]|nr:type II toxin-antitoxin system HicB family antitoxin [Dehalococcoidia bacterium]
MPELRSIRPRDAIAALERAGGIVRKSGKGDHVNLKMPNGQIVTFSGRRDPIKVGLLKAKLRKAGLTEQELVRFLEGGDKMEYVAVIHRAEEGGYWAEVPILPGCFAQGETLEELLEEAQGAIVSHLEALREAGQTTPLERVIIATVQAPELAKAS